MFAPTRFPCGVIGFSNRLPNAPAMISAPRFCPPRATSWRTWRSFPSQRSAPSYRNIRNAAATAELL